MPRIRDDEPGPGRTHALAARVAHAPEAEPNPAVEAQLRAPPAVARQPSRHRGDTAETGREALELVRATWFPAYRRAVDAFDAAAALELAHHVVRTLNVAEEAHHELDRDRAPSFGSQLAAVERDVATKIGPQMYRDKPTLGSYAPPQLGVYASGTIAAEAATMVELLAVIQQLRQVAAGAAGVAQRQVLSGLVQPFARRPVSFAFLARYMVETGVWQLVANDRNLATGATLEDADRAATEQLRETGPTADVGGLDARTLQRLLDGGIDDARAMTIVEKLATAALDARAPLLHQIDRAGKLDDLCAHLPWAYVQELHDSIVHRDPQLASRLTRYFEGKGGGRSMHRMYMDNFDEHAKQGHTVRAAGYFALDFLHNMLTAGFEHEYSDAYDAREEGLITDAQYRTQAHKALGKAAVILAVSALTGGAAGEFLEGASAGLGAGKQLSSIIGGTAGGAAAGAGGHLAGDVYDQLLSGKDGFDSLGDYAKSAAVGGAMGFAASALSSLSVGSGKYLGPDQARPVDTYAARYPQLARVLERIRATGFRSGSTVRMRVQELLDLVSSGFGGPGGPTAFALAGGGDVRALPPETEVEAQIRPLQSSSVGDGSATEPQVAIDKVQAADGLASSGFTFKGQELTVGDELGRGGEKVVHAVQGHPDLAVGIAKPDVTLERLVAEARHLAQLGELGLPVVDIAGTTEVGGRPAVVMKRFAQGSKTVVRTLKGKVKIVGESSLLNERSIADLENVEAVLLETPVWINDLQFLIGDDGSIVVADVLAYEIGRTPSPANLSTVRRLIDASRTAIAKRGAQ